ncbi:MAG: hypothetical protein JKY65_13760 [Planctomycetes bacterium]|nr:hypothetical protein [Planctomycetota bacterium]
MVLAIGDLPVWGAKQGHGSFLTMEFGDKIEPTRTLDDRLVERGEWHLWIYMCGWTIEGPAEPGANSESSREAIGATLERLEGTSLTDVEVEHCDAGTSFLFDEVCLHTHTIYPGDHELWMLYRPDGFVLSAYGSGHYSLGPGDSTEGHVLIPL